MSEAFQKQLVVKKAPNNSLFDNSLVIKIIPFSLMVPETIEKQTNLSNYVSKTTHAKIIHNQVGNFFQNIAF